MFRFVFPLVLLAATLTVRGQAGRALIGTVDGDAYVSPTGAFKIAIPVLPELGGQVSDTANVVTFKDDYGTLISIAAFPQNAGEKWKLQVRGIKDYLRGFFNDYVMPDFKRSFPEAHAENDAIFMPELMDGSLLTYLELPGGSMFAGQVENFDPAAKKPVAKRGNLIFVHNGFIFVVSTELAERVLEGSAYTMTVDEENLEIREKLTDVVNQIQFLKPSPAP